MLIQFTQQYKISGYIIICLLSVLIYSEPAQSCGAGCSSNPKDPLHFVHFWHTALGDNNWCYGSYSFDCDGNMYLFCEKDAFVSCKDSSEGLPMGPINFSYHCVCDGDDEYGVGSDPHKDKGLGKTCTAAGLPINVTNGNMYHIEKDLDLSTLLDLSFKRTYNSQSDYDGPLGYGWTHNYDISLDISNDYIYKISSSDGRGLYFLKMPDNSLSRLYANKSTSIENLDGTYTQITKDGQSFHFDSTGKLIETIDQRGNAITLNYENGLLKTISGQYGRTLTFLYYPNGKIETLTDPNGSIIRFIYEEDTNNLTSVTYPDNVIRSYQYDDPDNVHLLTSIKTNNELAALWNYDSQNRAFESSIDGINNKVTLSYPSFTETNVEDTFGNETSYTHQIINGMLMVKEIDGPGCSTCSGADLANYEYNNNFNLLSTTDRNGNITKYKNYDEKGNPGTLTEANGSLEERTTYYTYHPRTNEYLTITTTSILGPGNKITTYDYDDDGNETPNENPTSNVYRLIEEGYTQDETGEVIPYKYVTNYTNDEYGRVLVIDGPRDDVDDITNYEYYPNNESEGDNRGMLKNVTNALGHQTTFDSYDANGNLRQVTDPNGVVTNYTYNTRNWLKSITLNGTGPDSEDIITEYFYNDHGNIDYIKLPKGNVIDYDYDIPDRLSSITRRVGPDEQGTTIDSISYTYDTESNRTGEYYWEGEVDTGTLTRQATFDYNAYNRLWKIINPNGTYTKYGYDGNGNRNNLKDANTEEGIWNVEYMYDVLDRLTQVKYLTSPEIITSYQYDSHDNLTQVEDGNANITTYQYDDMGRLLSTTSPDAGTSTYTYDPTGNLVSKTDANGITTTFTYDQLNRLTLIEFPDLTQNITYTFDTCTNGIGRLCGMADPSGTTQYAYDLRGNISQEIKTIDSAQYTISYSYDINGNLQKIIYPTGRVVEYIYDSVDVEKVEEVRGSINVTNTTYATDLAYKPFGDISSMKYGNDITTSTGYDLKYQINSITSSVMDRSYTTIDDVGNIKDITSSDGDLSFTYPDPLYRLETASGNWGTASYAYDNVGNREAKTINGNEISYSYLDGANKLDFTTGAEPAIYTHDNNGNITSDGTLIFIYNQNNRLIQVTDGINPLADYVYDGQGRRIKKILPDGKLIIFLYDIFGNLLTEIEKDSGQDAESKDFIYLGSYRIAVSEHTGNVNSTTLASLTPDLNSPLFLTIIIISSISLLIYILSLSFHWIPSEFLAFYARHRLFFMIITILLVSTFVIGAQCPLETGQTYWYHNDHLGTPIKMTDKDQQIVWAADYYPFGKVNITTNNITNNHRFPGQYEDKETGLYYNWHRYYDSRTGRYVTPDPIGLLGGINPFVYTFNNPINNIDPDGNITITVGTIIIVITAVITAKFCYGIYKCFKAASNASDKVNELRRKYPLDTQKRTDEFFKTKEWNEVLKHCPKVAVESYTTP